MMLTTMKNYTILFLFIFFFSMVSCQTTRGDVEDTQEGAEEAAVGDVIDEDAVIDEEDEDLESEFADSEDLEQEMAEEAFPSEEGEEDEIEGTTEEVAEVTEEESEGAAEGVEEDTPTETEDSVAEVEEVDDDFLEDEDLVTDEDTDSSVTSGTSVVVNNIRYEAGENKIYIDGTGSLSYQSRENKSNNQVVIEIPGAVLSESLQERPFVMKDFNTEMALLQADQKDSDTVRIVVQMRGTAGMPSISVSETGSLVITPDGAGMVAGGGSQPGAGGGFPSAGGGVSGVDQSAYGGTGEVLPAKSLEEFFLHTPQFTGRPISIHLRDVSVRDVLYFISEGTGLNMVLSDDVTGNISIKLRNVPWDQALVTVMKTKKLGYLREGNVIRIMSLAALKKDQEDIRKMMESQKILDPLKVKVIPVIYTKASDVSKQLENLTTKNRGSIVVDNQSNSLIVTDTSRVIERIETMVKNLDKSPMQVLIEAKIIEARERFVRNLGVNWRYDGAPLSYAPGGNSQLALNVDGSLEAFPAANTVTGRTVSSGLTVSFAPLGDLDINLGLSEAEELIHVISAPRIVVVNGETAKITQKTQAIDLVTTTVQGGNTNTSPQRVSADLDFEVVPQITALGSVFMNVKMKRDFFGPPDATTGSRPINTREAETKVLVNNGQTIVIGGIYQKDESKSNEGIPILRHIPVLKWLFSRFTTDEERNELLLFLTPKVMEFNNTEESASIN